MTAISIINAAVAGCILWNALVNLNAITRRACVLILFVNLVLALGALIVMLVPLYGGQLAEAGHGLMILAFAALLRFGRRTVDRATPKTI